MDFPSLFSFCPHCAAALQPYVDDEILRRRCANCAWVQYRNPTVGVAVVLTDDSRLLIGRRRDGGWCIPCGHVEWDESIEEAAVREVAEETGLLVSLEVIFAVQSNFHEQERQTVGVWYRGCWQSGSLRPGGDLCEVAFFELGQLPDLKFPTDRKVVQDLRQELGQT